MYRRKFLLMLGVGVPAIPSKAEPTRTRKLGALNFRSLRPAVILVLRDALHERGYVEGRNLVIDYRFGALDEPQTLAAKLVRTDVELISCGASAPLRAELPIQCPTRFDVVPNLRTARRLGLTVPTSVQTRADVVIQ
jgi:hypothetical protein